MSKKKYFGIGCFNFGIKLEVPFTFKGDEYLDQLEKTLSKVSNLTNLEILKDEHFSKIEKKITKTLPHIQKDRGYFPETPYIVFDLYIPYKTQAKIIGSKKKYLRTKTENFNIKIISGFYLPVTIIESINPIEENEPSSSVRIVREYLKRELKEINSHYIRFESLGPTPFHLDCFLKPKKFRNDSKWFFEAEEVLQKGYDDLIIYYDKEEFEDVEEAMYNLHYIIADEIGYYYSTQQDRVYKMHCWQSIQKKINELLKLQKDSGVIGFYKKYFVRPKLIEKIFVKLITFERDSLSVENYKRNFYKQTFEIDDRILFKTFIDRQLNEINDYPIEQTSNLITFFESRRVKSLELTMAIIAALIGGGVGSLLTIYFQ